LWKQVSRLGTILLWGIIAGQLRAATPSSLVLPVEFDLSGFIAQAERELPTRFSAPWQAAGRTVKFPVAYRYELERGPLEVEGSGDQLKISTRVKYRVDVGLPAPSIQAGVEWRRVNGCQPRQPATVTLDTRVEFAPDWHLRARSIPQIKIAESCRLTAAREMVQVDISEKVRLAFADGLSKAARDFDRRLVEQQALRDLAERSWAGLHAPIPLGERLWLALQPSRVQVMRPVIHGRTLRTGVVIAGQPALLTELDTAAAVLPPLPVLELTPARDQFEMAWSAQMSWPDAVESFRQALRGKTVKVAGRRSVTIDEVDLERHGERVLVTAHVSGGLRGRIQLTGVPRSEGSVVEFADLEFTVETRNFLVHVADWFRHEATKRQLAKMARLDLVKTMDQSRDKLETALRDRLGNGLRLQGNVTALEPFAFAMDDAGLRIDARFTGTVVLAQ